MIDGAEVDARLNAIFSEFSDSILGLSNLIQLSAHAPSPTVGSLLLNSSIVTLVSMIEECIRDLISEYLRILKECILDFRHLRQKLRVSNIDALIEIIKSVKGDYTQAVRGVQRLLNCLSGSVEYLLESDRISYNRGNFKSKELTDVISRLGIVEPWSFISNNPDIEEYTGVPDVENRKNDLISRWNEIFDERDTVVHRMSQANGWAGEKIIASAELCKLVICHLSELLAMDAKSFLGLPIEAH